MHLREAYYCNEQHGSRELLVKQAYPIPDRVATSRKVENKSYNIVTWLALVLDIQESKLSAETGLRN
jgi:hypothetical protein